MYLACLDLEGVLIPEIWIAFSEACGIPELRRTTRDEPDYEKLMDWRIGVLHEHGLGIREMQNVIAGIEPLPGARAFWMRCAKRRRCSLSATHFRSSCSRS